ncbi:hypothetical protein HYV70_01235 [Candidatus Uhrbacteria bacterium]|nr:hypothetical protein [Candidatus Uhrbacteria bacterium]
MQSNEAVAVVHHGGEDTTNWDLVMEKIMDETGERPIPPTLRRKQRDLNYESMETGTFNTPVESPSEVIEDKTEKVDVLIEDLEHLESLVPPVCRELKLVEVADGKQETVAVSAMAYGEPRTRPPKGYAPFLDEEKPQSLLPSAFIDEEGEGLNVNLFPTPVPTPGETNPAPVVEETSFRPVRMFEEAKILAEMMRMEDLPDEEVDRVRDSLMVAIQNRPMVVRQKGGPWTYTPAKANGELLSFKDSIPIKENVGEEPLGTELEDDGLDLFMEIETEEVLELECDEDLDIEELLTDTVAPDTATSVVEIADEKELLHELETVPPIQDNEEEDEIADLEIPPPVQRYLDGWSTRLIVVIMVLGIFCIGTMIGLLHNGRQTVSPVADTTQVVKKTGEMASVPSSTSTHQQVVAATPVRTYTHCRFFNEDRPVGMDGRPLVICDEGTFTADTKWQGGGVMKFLNFTPVKP